MKFLKFIILKLPILLYLVCSFSYAQTSKIYSAHFYYKKGEKFITENKHFRAYENYIKSKILYQKLGAEDSVAKCNLKLFHLTQSQNNLNYDSKPFLDKYYQHSLKTKDTSLIGTSLLTYAQYYFSTNPELSINYYHQAINYSNNLNQKLEAYSNLALLYTNKSLDSAKYYFDKTLKVYTEKDKNQLFGTYINYANFFQKQNKFKEAIVQLKKAEKIEPTEYKLGYYKILYKKFADCYKELGDFKNAYIFYEKYNLFRDSLNNTNQNIAIADLDKKYQTAEKEKENLLLKQSNIETEAEKVKSQNLLIVSIAILLLVSIIAILSLKNSKRKRKLAEQAKDLATLKNLTFLKEQELTTINAMIDGQEKERKRIAEDLHDNLGSVLATLKMHFENLKINREKKKIDQDTLFNKTESLIDEAYLKVRRIAHAKNAGVIANQGLLLAVQMMAEKVTSAEKLSIEVVDFGLDNRLENSLEITVFRIIQELVTNIIKHANATKATINIALYSDNLNIIIEDNGKGFVLENTNLKNGMGISSIKTRIAHLKGTFEVDSSLQKGSTIIINIPIT